MQQNAVLKNQLEAEALGILIGADCSQEALAELDGLLSLPEHRQMIETIRQIQVTQQAPGDEDFPERVAKWIDLLKQRLNGSFDPAKWQLFISSLPTSLGSPLPPEDALRERIKLLRELKEREELELKLLQLAEQVRTSDPEALRRELMALTLPTRIETTERTPHDDLLSLPEEAYVGVAAEFADLYSKAVESPRSFLYFSYLTCLGALVGDRVALKGATRNPARLYTVLLGPSGSARKSTAIKLAVEGFQKAAEQFPLVRGLGSAEGLAKVLEQRNYTNCLLCFDELRAFVDKARIDGSVLLALVSSLFEDSYAENHTKGHAIELSNVHLSILSACTLETFANLFNSQFLAIGFPNRLLLILDDAKDRKPVPREIPREQEMYLQKCLSNILSLLMGYTPANPLLVGLTTEAESLWGEFYNTIPRTMSGIRVDQIGLRLAMLLALSSGKTEIDAATIKAAVAACKWQIAVRDEVLPIEADNKIAAMEQAIRRALKSRGPLRERELKRRVNAGRAGLWIFDVARENLKRAGELIFDPKNRIYAIFEDGPATP